MFGPNTTEYPGNTKQRNDNPETTAATNPETTATTTSIPTVTHETTSDRFLRTATIDPEITKFEENEHQRSHTGYRT